MTITIRHARQGDEGLVLDFIRRLAEFEKLSHEVVADEASLGRHLFGERPFARVIVGEWGGVPAAFALYFFTYSTFLARPTLYLEDLFVLPELRGKGIGEAMLRALARVAVDEGCGRMEWSVLDWNENALRFYRRLGAAPMSEWTIQRITGESLVKCAEGAVRVGGI